MKEKKVSSRIESIILQYLLSVRERLLLGTVTVVYVQFSLLKTCSRPG